jgi:hypothetical protein
LGLRLQIIRMTPRRLTTLQCSQIGFTLLRTFTKDSESDRKKAEHAERPRFGTASQRNPTKPLTQGPRLTCTKSAKTGNPGFWAPGGDLRPSPRGYGYGYGYGFRPRMVIGFNRARVIVSIRCSRVPVVLQFTAFPRPIVASFAVALMRVTSDISFPLTVT